MLLVSLPHLVSFWLHVTETDNVVLLLHGGLLTEKYG